MITLVGFPILADNIAGMSYDSGKDNASVVDSSVTEGKHETGLMDEPGTLREIFTTHISMLFLLFHQSTRFVGKVYTRPYFYF